MMTSLLDFGRAGLSIDRFPIIDMHGHLGRYGFAIPDLSPTGMVTVMDRLGVQSIACSHMYCMDIHAREGNREVLTAMQAAPGRILGYISLWPWSPDEVRQEVEWGLETGFIGIKLHDVNGFSYTDSAYAPAFEIADDLHLPVLVHSWGSDQLLGDLCSLSRRYPDISLLAAHAGSANIDGYLKLAHDCGNIYLDLAFSLAPRGVVAHLVREAGAEKVVWGSDAYFFSQAQQIGKVLGARISEEEQRLVLSENALRILGRRLANGRGPVT